MAVLPSSGIYGFLCSAKKKAEEYVSTFVSGVSGLIIKNNGNAEFKSIYARDKIVTNEYVYNRIRVTEDEEIVTSNGKILSATDNEDGTFTIYLDLREGDINPFYDGDMLQGYYHSPDNSGVIYAVQKMNVQQDPDKDDQSMIVTCEDGSIPYKYMIIVRVGNLYNIDRQSFIKISSRTNSQYFFDNISSWAALDNPDNVRCVLGKADLGLIPSWAVNAIGSVRKWFGLIADGVILRGTFILKSSNRTVETELDGINQVITDVETRFEVKEGQISSAVKEAKTYSENAAASADTSANAADSAAAKLEVIEERESSINQTAKGIEEKVSEITTKVDSATDTLQEITKKELSINKTAEGVTSKVTEVQKIADTAAGSAAAAGKSANDANSKLIEVTKKESSVSQMAGEINTKVTETKTYSENASKFANAAAGSASSASDSAGAAAGSATAAANSAKDSEAAKIISVQKSSEAKQTADGFQSTVSEVTKKAVNDAIAGVDSTITDKVSTQVTQSARQWKIEVLGGEDTVLAAINADKSGVQIMGEKIQITGTLLAEIIKASGLNINDRFVIDRYGRVNMCGEFKTGQEGARVYINQGTYGPYIRMYASGKTPIVDMRAFIYEDGTPDISIKMLSAKNLNNWAEYGVSKCVLTELEGGVQYETVIEAGRIKLFKNSIETWSAGKK